MCCAAGSAELLEALAALDRAGVDHRDIKPANLGVREGRSDRAKHLVLFDFSLSRAGATAVTAGTPPYLDPFLDDAGRGRYDSAAERYSAAVVLFEMATGAGMYPHHELLIARAGRNVTAEAAYCGIPAILLRSPPNRIAAASRRPTPPRWRTCRASS